MNFFVILRLEGETMEKYQVQDVLATSWPLVKPKGIIIIAHGMAEHANRYNEFAQFLNQHQFAVYAIHHLGHGEAIGTGIKGHWPKDGFATAALRIGILVDSLKSKFAKVPIIYFGHSMGSFIGQRYISEFHNVDGVIFSGSNGPNFLNIIGNGIATLASFVSPATKPNQFLNQLSFGSFNQGFKPSRTAFDWLSTDPQQVDLYVNDPLCGYVCTTGFFKEFLHGLAHLYDKSALARIRKDLPIYLYSGQKDPVSNQGKGVLALEKVYRQLGIKDLTVKLYPNGRHEMHNEVNRQDVYRDVVDWINTHVLVKQS